MALAEKIVAWGRERPPWQREIMVRIAQGDILADDDYDRLIDRIVAPVSGPAIRFGLEHLPAISAQGPAMRINAIARTEHVNALTSPQPLTFAPCGLTIVYGDNGSGKSGYARLLKQITRARHQEKVHSDVFRDTANDKPVARLEVAVGEQDLALTWPDPAHPALARMHFYDRACLEAYISRDADYPYRPAELDVMHGLIRACSLLRERIDRRLDANAQAVESLPTVSEEVKHTAVGQFLTQLSDRSSVESLDKLIAHLADAPTTLDEIRREEQRLRNADSGQEQQQLRRQTVKLEDLHQHIKRVHAVLGRDGLARLQAARDRLRQSQAATDQLAQAFQEEHLPGVGSSPWQTLWEAAKRFSVEMAYPDRSFPLVEDESRCVLCHQLLDSEGRKRLLRFEEFVREDTQVKFEKDRQAYDALEKELTRQQVSTKAIANHLGDLESGHSDLIEAYAALLARYQRAQENALDELSGTEPLTLPDIEPAGILDQLIAAAASTQQAAVALDDPEAVQQELAQVTVKRQELELLQEVRQARETIDREIQRRRERTALEAAKAAAATGPITNKIRDFTEEAITGFIRDRFTREADRLQLERVTLERTRAAKGTVFHQPTLVSARQAVPLPDVFSEGERSALGLAAFFTEVTLDTSQSAIILDDPVTSLDHIRRGHVAKRLATLAAERQVIVFTHDLAFVSELQREVARLTVPVTTRWVARSQAAGRKPGTCYENLPWKAKDVKQRLDELRTGLVRIEKEEAEWDPMQYENQVALWAGRLSQIWERIFTQEIVGMILAEGGLEVRVQLVRLMASFSDEDYREFDASYSRVSQWAPRHDPSVHVNYNPPEVSELKTELQRVEDWFNRVKRYKNI